MSPSGSRTVAVVVALSLTAALATPNSSYAGGPGIPRSPEDIEVGPGRFPSPTIDAPSTTAPVVPPPIISPTLPELPPTPRIETPPVPPAAGQVPAAPVVRFRCDLAPDSYECTKPDSADGGGDDEKCNCARDHCRINRIGNRVCEKLQ